MDLGSKNVSAVRWTIKNMSCVDRYVKIQRIVACTAREGQQCNGEMDEEVSEDSVGCS